MTTFTRAEKFMPATLSTDNGTDGTLFYSGKSVPVIVRDVIPVPATAVHDLRNYITDHDCASGFFSLDGSLYIVRYSIVR